MVSKRGRVSKDEPEAFEGASAARVNLCLCKWRRFFSRFQPLLLAFDKSRELQREEIAPLLFM